MSIRNLFFIIIILLTFIKSDIYKKDTMDIVPHMIAQVMAKVKMIQKRLIQFKPLKTVLMKVLLENMNVAILNIKKMKSGKPVV